MIFKSMDNHFSKKTFEGAKNELKQA